MRLWHQDLIRYLPDKQLLGQHRELCALRGLGFGKKHKIVDYVFQYSYANLYHFHLIVMEEMTKRGFMVNNLWNNIKYRGKRIGFDNSYFTNNHSVNKIIYQEHNIDYLKECLENLNSKKVFLNIPKDSYLYQILSENNLEKYIKVIE